MYAPSKENYRAFTPTSPEYQGYEEELAFTKKQRDWYLRIYGGVCHFPVGENEDGTHKICGSSRDLQVHHITPASWTLAQTDIDPNDTPGVVLCKHHHTNVIHPEIGDALRHYREDPEAIKRAVSWHKTEAEKGNIFWVSDFDEFFKKAYEFRKDEYEKKHPESKYPKDKKWERQHERSVRLH